jgi:hypothetical protein
MKLTAECLLKKANSKEGNSIVNFISNYRKYMLSEISETIPIISKIDSSIYPEAMFELKNAIFSHIIKENEKKINKFKNKKVNISRIINNKKFEAKILNKIGDVVESKKFDMPQQAERWCDRQLEYGSSDWHGEVFCKENFWSYVNRRDSLYRIYKEHRKITCGVRKKTTNRLGFGIKAKQSKITFSHG